MLVRQIIVRVVELRRVHRERVAARQCVVTFKFGAIRRVFDADVRKRMPLDIHFFEKTVKTVFRGRVQPVAELQFLSRPYPARDIRSAGNDVIAAGKLDFELAVVRDRRQYDPEHPRVLYIERRVCIGQQRVLHPVRRKREPRLEPPAVNILRRSHRAHRLVHFF